MSVNHYENFPVASFLVPARLRAPIEVIYRFARSADDIADEGQATDSERLDALATFGAQLRRVAAGRPAEPEPARDLFDSLGATMAKHGLPVRLFEDLLDAFSQDVVKKDYADYPELLDYCRRSANPVGRLLLYLYGVSDQASLACSDAICTSLQLINFWQDVAVDRDKGRVYLPRDSLSRFGFDSAAGKGPAACDARFRALLGFEVARTRALMLAGAPLALRLPGRIGWELRLVVQGGLRILERIEQAGFDVFAHRPVLKRRDWMLMAWRALCWARTAPVQ